MTQTPREAWLLARKSGIGGSDLGAIMGLSPWASAFSVFAEKVGLTDGTEQTERMAWGNRHESTISEWYREETGRWVYGAVDVAEGSVPLRDGVEVVRFDNPEGDDLCLLKSMSRPWHLGTPDNFALDDKRGWGVLELKCAAFGKKEWENGPPSHYLVQLQSYLALSGCSWGSFAVMFDLYSAGYIDVERDDEMISRIYAAGDDMWRRIQENDPPEADGSDASRRALDAVLGTPTDDIVVMPPDALAWDEDYLEAKEEMKAAEKRKKAAENRIRQAMGEASTGTLSSGVTWNAKIIEATEHKRAYRRYTRKEAK